VILVDVNILIYAHTAESPSHTRARDWLDGQLSGDTRVAIPWQSLLAFLRLMTNPRILARPEPMDEAWAQVRRWLDCPVVWTPQPGERHAEILEQLLKGSGATANLVPDAHLAALAIEHGLTVCSADADFARFDGVRWMNPLVASHSQR
jgi:toxin-antitoxin system PIN domain toxin